jgi:16S rRNA (cytidine1402-2'-O)-methyltransferase
VSDAGTPTVSDPGGELIRSAIAAGIRVEPIPGPSAVLAILAASGLPTDTFSFHGFPPTRAKDRTAWFAKLSQVGGTVVFFEAPHRIRETLSELKRFVGDCPVVIGRELTKLHEELVRGQITAVLSNLPAERGEFTVAVYVGQSPDNSPAEPPSETDLAREVGELTITNGLTKRKAIGLIARRYGLAPNDVYAAVEAAKKSGM